MQPSTRTTEFTERRAAEREVDALVAVLRAIFIGLFALSVTLGPRAQLGEPLPLLYGIVAGAVYNLAVAWWYWRGRHIRGERTLIVGLDLLMFSAWIYLSGDDEMARGLFNFYFLLVGVAGLWFGGVGTMSVAVLASGLYLGALAYLNPLAIDRNLHHALTVQIPFLLFLGLVVGVLGSLQRRERERGLQARALIAEHQERVRMAQELYEVLVPAEPPQLPGLSIGARFRPYLPAGAGDYYAFAPLGPHRYGICLADIAGKYTAALTKIPLLKYASELAARQHDDPGQILRGVNDLIFDDFQPDRFVSALYLVVDLARGTLTYANAGHEPPLFLRGGEARISHLEMGGSVLCLERDLQVPVVEVPIAVGDTLVLYTDGVTAVQNGRREEFGTTRLAEVAATGSELRLNASQLADRLFEAVDNFGPVELRRDDLTILVIRVDTLVPAEPPLKALA